MTDKGRRLLSVVGRARPVLVSRVLVALSVLGAPPAASPLARQQETAVSLAMRSAVVVRGTVLRLNASEEPNLVASANTLVIKVTRMYSGAEIAGDQTGRSVTVILRSPPRFKEGDEAIFFGNPRFVGKTMTIADEGEIPASDSRAAAAEIERGLRARSDVPVRARLAVADMVFRGRVEGERPLPAADAAARTEGRRPPGTEHDPEWHVATVRVVNPIRGVEGGATVSVIFPASRDIEWFNSPKLKPGMEAVFITHKPLKEEEPLLRATGVLDFLRTRPAELVTEPFDVLAASDETRARELLTKEVR